METSAEGVLIVLLDRNLWVITANRAFLRTFRLSRRDIQGRPFCLLNDGQLIRRELLKQLEKLVRQNTIFEAYELEMGLFRVGRRTMRLNARKIVCDQEDQSKIVLIFKDTSDQHALSLQHHNLAQLPAPYRPSTEWSGRANHDPKEIAARFV